MKEATMTDEEYNFASDIIFFTLCEDTQEAEDLEHSIEFDEMIAKYDAYEYKHKIWCEAQPLDESYEEFYNNCADYTENPEAYRQVMIDFKQEVDDLKTKSKNEFLENVVEVEAFLDLFDKIYEKIELIEKSDYKQYCYVVTDKARGNVIEFCKENLAFRVLNSL